MIALYVIANAYAAAVIITAGRLYILGCAHRLARALAAYNHPPPTTPLRIAPQPLSRASVQAHTPVLKWPRDN